MSDEGRLRIHSRPGLVNPRMVLAWGCIGQVGMAALTYLRDKLGAEEFGDIEPYDFFNVPATVRDGLVELEFPQNRLYCWKKGEGKDLILFIAEREPPLARYEYAHLLLQVAQQFGVESIYTVCAFPSLISHTAEPRVFAVVNDAKLVKYMEQHGIAVVRDRELTSMNALLLSLARSSGVEGIYLLGEVPSYATTMSNPKTAKAVLRFLLPMLGIAIDMAELDGWIEQAEEEMDRVAKEASRTFLQDFTIDYRDLFSEE